MSHRPAAAAGLAPIAVLALWAAALGGEAWLGARAPASDAPAAVAIRVRVLAPPEYGVSAPDLEAVVREVLRARAPGVAVAPGAGDRVEVVVELGPIEGVPDGYRGWVRLELRRERRGPRLTPAEPVWTDRILVFGAPPRVGSSIPRNVAGAVRLAAENLVARGLPRLDAGR